MGMHNIPDEVTTRQALEILGYSDPSTVTRYVQIGKLTPTRKLPGKTGAYLFARADVEQLAREQSVEAAS